MRLFELQPAPKDIQTWRKDNKPTPKWHNQLDDMLSKYGYVGLGQGAHGSVYENPNTKKVIKVFSRDSHYIEWIKFARAHQDNPWVPKFRSNLISLKKLANPGWLHETPADVYAVALEKLTPLSSDDPFPYQFIVFVRNYKTPTWDPPPAKFRDLLEDSQFLEVVDFLQANIKGFDIVRENIMLRGDQLVITDPLGA